MPLELAACKIPKDWMQKIDSLARESGSTRSDVLKQAIAQFIGESPQAAQSAQFTELTETLTALTQRVEQLEKTVRELERPHSKQLTTVNSTERSEASETISDAGENIQAISQTPARDDSQRTNPPNCPKCGSEQTRFWGRGKIRSDGTRAQRISCLNCRKISSIG